MGDSAKKRGNRRLQDRLSEAVSSGDPAKVREALDAGADPALGDSCGSLPLHSAAMCLGGAVRIWSSSAPSDPAPVSDGPGVIRLLVERGAPIESRDDHGLTPLLAATIAGSVEEARVLLELGASPAARRTAGDPDRRGETGLHIACSIPRQDRTPALVDRFLEAGIDPSARTERGATPLHLLCQAMVSGAALRALERLLEAGADPRSVDRHGRTPLLVLEEEGGDPFGQGEAARLARERLLAAGAQDAELAPLRLVRAAESGDLAAVRAALDAGGDPLWEGRRSGPALPVAARKGHVDVVRELLARGVPSGHGGALLGAVAGGHAGVVEALLAAGADPNDGEPFARPLDRAREGSDVERLLVAAGARRTTLSTLRGCPNFDLTQQVILFRAPAAAVVDALTGLVAPARVERGVKGKRVDPGAASLLVYQLTGHGWSALQPVSGKSAANRFGRELAVELSRALRTGAVLYDNSDSTATFGWELLEAGETRELWCGGDREAPPLLVPFVHAESVAGPIPPDEEGEDVDLWFSAEGRDHPDAAEAEEILDRRANELDLLVPSWSPRDLAGKAGKPKAFFPQERKETFAAVDLVVLVA